VDYLQGIGTDVNATASAQWFEKAANSGDTDAQYALASLYAKGQGVAQNYKKAKSLYEKAAVGGNDQAAARLSLALAEGELGQSDPQGALRWALLCANRGNAPCQFIAGSLLFEGTGGKPDYVEAHKWANLAFASGDSQVTDGALEIRTRAEEKLTAEQIAEAQQLAATWKPRTAENATESPEAAPALKLPAVSDTLADSLSAQQAKLKLRKLGIPIARVAYFKAIETDNIGVLKLFHKAGADLETSQKLHPGITGLYWAVDFGSYKSFKYFMANKANVNARSPETGMTPLVRALAHERMDMVDALLRAGADASQPPETLPENQTSLLGATALSYAVWFYDDEELVRRLLNAGASVSERYTNHETPLIHAAENNHPKSVKVLLDAGADASATDDYGRTALLHALMEGVGVDDPAKKVGRETISLLLAGGSPVKFDMTDDATPLFAAIWQGDPQIVSLLLQSGANANERYQFKSEHIPVGIEDQAVRELIMHGATPLMLCIALENAPVAKLLLDAGADPSLHTEGVPQPQSALDLARRSPNSAISKLLASFPH
jgi:ankyrin repeat protein